MLQLTHAYFELRLCSLFGLVGVRVRVRGTVRAMPRARVGLRVAIRVNVAGKAKVTQQQ